MELQIRMLDQGRDFSSIRLLGGRLCLDFINTVNVRYPSFADEYLNTYEDLLNWSQYAGALTPSETTMLASLALEPPDAAIHVFDRAIELREALHRIFVAIIHKNSIAEADLDMFNVTLTKSLPNLMIRPVGHRLDWQWAGDPTAPDRMLWAVIRSAADLLTLPELSHVRECPEEYGCGWLFLDTSKNHSRRWCSMETCGNTAKARRHYSRQQLPEK